MKNNQIYDKNNQNRDETNGLMSLAGCWKRGDDDTKEFLSFTRKGRKNWKITSV